MQIKYFDTAWNDIAHSPGWFVKVLQLSLLSFIPIFGPVVVSGYLYGWAREIAWGVHEPMPQRIFANEDGKLYRRGFYIFVMSLAFALALAFVASIGSTLTTFSLTSMGGSGGSISGSVFMTLGSVISLVGWVASIAMVFFIWVASMRIAIYDCLSAGFQLGKIWKMIKHDVNGIARIFGMNLLVSLVGGLALSLVCGILFTIFGVTVGAGLIGVAASATTEAAAEEAVRQYLLSGNLGGIVAGALILGFVCTFICVVLDTFVEMLTARALGYWTMQFDVPRWRGQDDPMPFELVEQGGGVPLGTPVYVQSQPRYQDQNPLGYQEQDSSWIGGAPVGDSYDDPAQQSEPESIYDEPMTIPASFLFDQEPPEANEAIDVVPTDADVLGDALTDVEVPDIALEEADASDVAFADVEAPDVACADSDASEATREDAQ